MTDRGARTLTDRADRADRAGAAARDPVGHLVRALDYERPHLPSRAYSLDGVTEVELGRGEEDRVARNGRALALAFADRRMSQQHARLQIERGRWLIEDRGSRNGTVVDGARVTRRELADGALIELGRTALLYRVLEPSLDAGAGASSPLGVHTLSPAFARALADLSRIALTGQSIVLQGESGTGKEVLARGVYAASRRSGALVAVNCGALPETLVESELFGYRKGAFSGATEDRIGLVRAADGGTLFLDEIGDLPLPTQAALLRVLQEREVTPVGATQPITVDVRVIAASHRDLEQEIAAGRFREDLLARLAGYVVEIPPLRDRREDLGILIAALLSRRGAGVRFAPAAGSALLRHAWPRNVRELEQVLGTATVLATDGVIELEHLPVALRGPAATAALDLSPSELQRRDELRRLLAKHRGNIAAVGRELGVARMQVHRWLDRFSIDAGEFR